jgi:hypothetical protein
MGLETIAISKARWVADDGGEDAWPGDPGYRFSVSSTRERLDGWKSGHYVVRKGGRIFNGWDGPYSAYNEWRKELSLLALGVEPLAVWTNPRRFRHKPFVELIDFPDGGGLAIGPTTSAKLYQDFVAFAGKARKHFVKRSPTITPLFRVAATRKNLKRHWHKQAGGMFVTRSDWSIGGSVPVAPPEDRRWMLDVYRSFRGAFRTASDDGFVFFW